MKKKQIKSGMATLPVIDPLGFYFASPFWNGKKGKLELSNVVKISQLLWML